MSHSEDPALKAFQRLIEIVRTLRAPDGCPWDREQTPQTMRKFLMEESQEAAEALDEGDPLHVCEELGDVMMIVTMLAQMAAESGTFTITEALQGINEKLVARHPHIFQGREDLTSSGVVAKWKELKKTEKKEKARVSNRMREVAGFASSLQACRQIQAEAAMVGFDFPNQNEVIAKLGEEIKELSEAHQKKSMAEMEEELGDLLFSVVNVSRLLKIDPDKVLRRSSEKFVRRFSKLEERVEADGGFAGKDIRALDRVWDEIKREEKAG